jgi:ketosteroid isomerase-like protein
MGSVLAQEDPSPQQIAESTVASWNEAFAHGRVDEILSFYTSNAMVVHPNGTVSKSLSEIKAFWQTVMEKRAGVIAFRIVEARGEREGTIVTEAKLSDLKTLQNPHQTMNYEYDGVLYSVLKRQTDGSWKAEAQRWTDRRKS